MTGIAAGDSRGFPTTRRNRRPHASCHELDVPTPIRNWRGGQTVQADSNHAIHAPSTAGRICSTTGPGNVHCYWDHGGDTGPDHRLLIQHHPERHNLGADIGSDISRGIL
jgi:hypothetical protein